LENSLSILPKHLYGLDAARGLAALAVVFWHWQSFFYPPAGTFTYPNVDFTIYPWYSFLAPFYTHGHAAVSFFFVLSGFVFFWLYGTRISDRAITFRTFVLARFARLYPLHFATVILVTILQFIYSLDHSHFFVYPNNDLYHFVLNLLLVSHWGIEKGLSFNGPVWSVSIEIGLYLAFWFFCFFRFYKWKWVLFFLLFLQVIPLIVSGIGRWTHPLECFFLGGLTYFLVTAYLALPRRSRKTDRLLVACTVIGWLFLILSTQVSVLAQAPCHLFSRILVPLTIAALTVSETSLMINFHPFRIIGEMTYSVYLLHFPLQLCFAIGASKLGFENEIFTSPIVLILYFTVLILSSIYVYRGFERPIQTYLLRSGQSPKSGKSKFPI
jgi:peptidoglycan/LPS O-acetylase OafA/YrhL